MTPRKLNSSEKAFFLALLLIGVLAALFFPPLWITYFFGGVLWCAYLGTRRGRQHND